LRGFFGIMNISSASTIQSVGRLFASLRASVAEVPTVRLIAASPIQVTRYLHCIHALLADVMRPITMNHFVKGGWIR